MKRSRANGCGRAWLAVAIVFAPAAAAGQGTPPEAPAAAPAPVEPRTIDEEFEKRLADIDRRAGEIQSLRASFEQRKHTALLRKPLVSRGGVAILGERSRWETREPRPSVITSDDKALRIYYPEQKVVEVYELGSDVREFTGTPLPRLDKLREVFEVAPIKPSEAGGKNDDAALVAIELTPKAEALKQHITRVRVLIDSTKPCARRIEVVDVDGDRTEVEFTDVVLDAQVEVKDVAADVPPGTRETHPLGAAPPATEHPEPPK